MEYDRTRSETRIWYNTYHITEGRKKRSRITMNIIYLKNDFKCQADKLQKVDEIGKR